MTKQSSNQLTSSKARQASALFFVPDSPLHENLRDFRYRPDQKYYAEYIEAAIEQKTPLLIEAGTGTGKTLGYLLPLIQSGQKVMISTGTKTLQDQLFLRDLPNAVSALSADINIALLKGRSNYLCLHRLYKLAEQPVGIAPADISYLQALLSWSETDHKGEFSDSPIAEHDQLQQQLSATSDHCLGRECPYWSDCFLVKARQKAQHADLVVVNHHLVCADLHLREAQQIEVLPMADVMVFDEAHQLPKIIMDFFSDQTTLKQMLRTLGDAQMAIKLDVADDEGLVNALKQLEQEIQQLLRDITRFPGRWAWSQVAADPKTLGQMQRMHVSWDANTRAVVRFERASKDVERCGERMRRIAHNLARFLASADGMQSNEGDSDNREPLHQQSDGIRWVEIAGRNARWMYTPLDAGDKFASRLEALVGTPIFTSATLESGGSFEHIRKAIGMPESVARATVIPGPYDPATQILRYRFADLPEPSDPLYFDKVWSAITPLLDATNGRAFILTTSHRDIQRAERFFDRNPLSQTILYQGSAPKNTLLEQFRKDGNAVLVGTQSFWEGVDIKGAALSCVIITKLPFAPPDDPVLNAKSELVRANGENPFMVLQLPEAIILFKQGIGRLIRDEQDKGILAIADPRIYTKRYGVYFRHLIEGAPETDDLDRVATFLS